MKDLRIAVLTLAATLLPSFAVAQPKAYVVNQSLNVVHVLDTTDWSILPAIAVGTAPSGIAIPTSGGFALVSNRGSNDVSRFDLATGTVTATIPVPGNPTAIGVTPNGAKAYVVQSTNCPPPPVPTPTPVPIGPTPLPTPDPTPGPTPSPTPIPPCTVAVIDTASNAVIGNITVGHEPFAIGMSPSGGFAYVTNRADDSVSIIDTSTDTVIDELPVGETPEGIFVGFGEVYIANDVSNSVSVYREVDFQPLTAIPVGASPLAVTVSPDGRTAVAGNDLGTSVSIIETGTETVIATKDVGTNPTGIAITSNSVHAVVTNSTSGTLSIVTLNDSPSSPVATQTVLVQGSPVAVAIEPTPFFEITKVATPEAVEAGGTVIYTIDYLNRGNGPGVTTTITDVFPPELTFVSATNGGALVGPDLVWNLGTVPLGATGSVQATFNVAGAPPLVDGDEISNVVTIADLVGNSAMADATIGTRVPGGLGVIQGNYNKKNAIKPRDAWRFKSQIPAPFPGFDNTQDVTITWSTPTQVITSFTIPAEAWVGRASSNRFRFSQRDLVGQGSRVVAQLALRGNGFWRLNVNLSNVTLPIVDLPDQITITANFGFGVFSSTREFRVRRTSKPNTQRLSYRSVIAGD